MVGRFPISMLFITIEPQELDVNVHPTKTEVRLKNSPRVFSAVHLAIRKTISAYSPVPAFPQVMWSTETTDRPAASDAWISPAMRFPAMGTDPKSADFQPADNTAASDLPLLRSIGQLGLTYLAADGPDGL
jgi:DNA mismatch repair protein MutL